MAIESLDLSEPVGFGNSSLRNHRPVRNLRIDVVQVQEALNQIPFDRGGASPKLVVNGTISGPNDPTVVAIRRFQQKTLGFQDGVVDPDNKTAHQLNAALGPSPKPQPQPKPQPSPTPSPTGITIVPQPPGEVFLLTLLPDDDGQGGRRLKEDLDGTNRQLSSSSKLAKIRVWAAKLGLGAAVLDELEQAALDPASFDLKTFLLKMLAAGKLEKGLFDEITLKDITSFSDVDLGRLMSPRAVASNEGLLKNEMSVGGPTALTMFSFWTTNSAVPSILKNFPALDIDTSSSPNFVRAAVRFEDRLKANLQRQFSSGLVDYHDLVTGPGPERVPGANVPPEEPGKATLRLLPSIEPILPDLSLIQDTVVKICIGSFQGIRVSLSDWQAKVVGLNSLQFSGTLQYELRDHFGVDDEDCEVRARGIHGTPGQVAMWVLQHYAPSGHKPFIDQVLVKRTFSGSF